MSLPSVHTIWVGDTLPLIPRLTLASFVRCGHPVILHSYKEFENIPKGVTRENANRIMPESSIFRHRSGSLALFSDIFRLRLLKAGADIYSDLDVFCLKALPKRDYLMAYEHDTQIGSGLLSLPPDSPLLAKMLEAADDPAFIPPWFSAKRRRRYAIRKYLGFPKHIADMPWATIGPTALTWYAKRTGENQYALPSDYLYPVSHTQQNLLFDPGLRIHDLITSRTLCIHIYAEFLRRYGLPNIPPSSPMGEMLAMMDITS
jgi:hypothetical protein